MRAPASRARESAIFSSTMPPPTATVSAACASALSPSATAAAMPPCAQALDAPSPSGAAEISVTGRGASFSAQNNPARPPPTMTTSSVLRVRSWILVVMSLYSILQVDHPLDRTPRLRGDRGIDGDFLAQVNEALQNVGQRDALHVRTEIARPRHLDVRQLGLHIVGHRALGD